MRYQSGHAEVLAEGFGQAAGFSILASGKAFKGLIDGIYSRKIEAGIRELATNAFDSHKAAGSIAPFEVHLPTALKPTFYIRDFGVGMSHHYMMNRYTVMFDSTKDGAHEEDQKLITSDEQVGMLGLGRMAFFAYTDSCTVTIWQGGEVRFYSVFMGPDGVPQVAHAGTSPSDEPTGVKVEFPVKAKDLNEFESAAVRVFKGFPIAPKGLSISPATAIAEEPKQIGSFWKAYNKDYLPKGGFWARQGCVLYPIDLEQIDDRSVEKEESYWDYTDGVSTRKTRMVPVLSERFQRFNDMGMAVVIDFPIGSLEFDLSRERLAYTDRTVVMLRKRWEEFSNDLDSLFAKQFAAVGSGWSRMALAQTDSFTNFGTLFITSSFNHAAHETLTRLLQEVPSKRNVDMGEAIRSVIINFGQTDAYPLYTETSFTSASEKHGELDKAVFIFLDEEKPRAINKRTLHYLQTNDLKWAFIIDKGRLKPGLIKDLGNPTVVRSSDLPAAPRASSRGGSGKREPSPPFERIKLIDENGNFYTGATSEEEYEGHLFAFLNCGSVYNPDPDRYPHMGVSDIMAIHSALRYFKGQSISFINIKANEYTKIADKWGDFPLFYGCFDDSILDDIGPKDLRDLVNLINYERFSQTKYANASGRWCEHFSNSSDPLAAMRRFEWRVKRIPTQRRNLLRSFINGSTLQPLVDQIIDRAVAAGLEVLPPMHGGSYNVAAYYPYPLLPKKWEQLVKRINQSPHNLRGEQAKFTFTAIKEKIGC